MPPSQLVELKRRSRLTFIRFKLSLNTYMHFLAARPMGLTGCSTSMLQKVAQGRAHATATCRLSLQSSAHRRRLWRRLLLAAASTKHRVDSCTQPASWQQCWWPVWLRTPALALRSHTAGWLGLLHASRCQLAAVHQPSHLVQLGKGVGQRRQLVAHDLVHHLLAVLRCGGTASGGLLRKGACARISVSTRLLDLALQNNLHDKRGTSTPTTAIY